MRFTWGLGYGELSTDPGPDVARLDGPCFHRARDALRAARQVEVAERFGVDPSTVSRALSAASFARIREGEGAARTFLESLTRATVDAVTAWIESVRKDGAPLSRESRWWT